VVVDAHVEIMRRNAEEIHVRWIRACDYRRPGELAFRLR
jgi:hypothetical protein